LKKRLILFLLSNFSFILILFDFTLNRIIDVGSEWRTFANDKESTDMTRVGAAEVIYFHYFIVFIVFIFF